MSIVGTRPPLISETNLYEPRHKVTGPVGADGPIGPTGPAPTPAAAVADATGTEDAVTQLNTLLANLRAAGILQF